MARGFTQQLKEQAVQKNDPNDSPVVWMAVLEKSLIARDLQLEQQARNELARIGVRVYFDRLPGERPTGGACHGE